MPIGFNRTKESFCLRVISGHLRGLKLESADGPSTRPTLDRVKEALFSMLFSFTSDASGLDLFAGSGALGIELMSRYGKECTFVDSSKEAVRVISANVKKARLEDKTRIVNTDAISFLLSTDQRFDIIFIDPPYAMGLYGKVLSVIKERELLNKGGLITLECSKDQSIDFEGFTLIKDKTYGKVRLCVLEAKQK